MNRTEGAEASGSNQTNQPNSASCGSCLLALLAGAMILMVLALAFVDFGFLVPSPAPEEPYERAEGATFAVLATPAPDAGSSSPVDLGTLGEPVFDQGVRKGHYEINIRQRGDGPASVDFSALVTSEGSPSLVLRTIEQTVVLTPNQLVTIEQPNCSWCSQVLWVSTEEGVASLVKTTLLAFSDGNVDVTWHPIDSLPAEAHAG